MWHQIGYTCRSQMILVLICHRHCRKVTSQWFKPTSIGFLIFDLFKGCKIGNRWNVQMIVVLVCHKHYQSNMLILWTINSTSIGTFVLINL